MRKSATSDKRLASIIWAALSSAWASFRAVLRVRTFQVLVLQVSPMPTSKPLLGSWSFQSLHVRMIQSMGTADTSGAGPHMLVFCCATASP